MPTHHRLPQNSLLRRLGQHITRTDDSHHRRLIVNAVIRLVAPDGADSVRWFRRHGRDYSRFLTACAAGDIPAQANEVQAKLNVLLPHALYAHLYVCARHPGVPSHYIRLACGADGLWRPRSRRINVVNPDKPLPRGGVMASWPQSRPDPGGACGLPIRFERVLTGGKGIESLVHEVQDCYSVRRQLSHCALIVDLLAGLPQDRLSARETQGKVVFDVRVPGSLRDASTVGFVEPLSFVPVSVRPYAPPVTKPKVILWADADALGASAPRCILPQIKNAALYEPQGFRDAQGRSYERAFLGDILFSRLLPFCGVERGNGRVDIYGLSYDPDTGDTAIVAYIQNRTLSACAMLPVFTPVPGRRRTWTPNARAVELLKGLLFEDDADMGADADRQRHLGYVFGWLGGRDVRSYAAAFAEWLQPLTLNQIKELQQRGGRL